MSVWLRIVGLGRDDAKGSMVSDTRRRLVKAALGLTGAVLIGGSAVSQVSGGNGEPTNNPSPSLIASIAVDAEVDEAKSWFELDLPLSGSDEEATLTIHFSLLSAQETDEVITIALPQAFYETYVDECDGQDYVDRTPYALNELNPIHRENLADLGVPISEGSSERPSVQDADEPQFRMIVASADYRQETVSWEAEVDGEEVEVEAVKDWGMIDCTLDDEAFWRTVEARRTVVLPGVAMGTTTRGRFSDELFRRIDLPSGAPLVYTAGYREPGVAEDGTMYWWDERDNSEDRAAAINVKSAEAVMSDIELQSSRDRKTLWIGIILGVAASLVVAAFSVAFDALWEMKVGISKNVTSKSSGASTSA